MSDKGLIAGLGHLISEEENPLTTDIDLLSTVDLLHKINHEDMALAEINLTAKDVVVGIAASGRTPYVIGGLIYAKNKGAVAVALSCNPHSEIAALADIAISPVVGPEAL